MQHACSFARVQWIPIVEFNVSMVVRTVDERLHELAELSAAKRAADDRLREMVPS